MEPNNFDDNNKVPNEKVYLMIRMVVDRELVDDLREEIQEMIDDFVETEFQDLVIHQEEI